MDTRTQAEHACSVNGALGVWIDFETECTLFNLVAVKTCVLSRVQFCLHSTSCQRSFMMKSLKRRWREWDGERFLCTLNYSVYISGGGSLSPKSIRAVYLFRECVCVWWTRWFCAQMLINRLVMTGWRLCNTDCRYELWIRAQSVVIVEVYSSRGSGSAPWPLTSTDSLLWAADPQLCWVSPPGPV